jgi:hypothetical protein
VGKATCPLFQWLGRKSGLRPVPGRQPQPAYQPKGTPWVQAAGIIANAESAPPYSAAILSPKRSQRYEAGSIVHPASI